MPPSASDQNQPVFQVSMQPVGRRTGLQAGKTLLDAAQEAGVELVSLCGGVGACDSCKVRLVSGQLSSPTLEEEANFTPAELSAGFRLACQAHPLSDVVLDIPPESLTTPQRLQVEGESTAQDFTPAITSHAIELPPPSLHDLRADSTRLLDGLRAAGVPGEALHPALLAGLSARLREYSWTLTVAMRSETVVGIFPPPQHSPAPLLGLAVDIGTTKLAAYLVDLSTGETLAKTGAMNPQIAYGEDVVSRIAYTERHLDGRSTLQRRMVESLNSMIAELCAAAGLPGKHDQILDAVMVGNTAMHHLFAGLPVHQLGAAPYVPAVGEALDLSAPTLGLAMAETASVHLPPNVAGYVGADHVSMALATGIYNTTQTAIALDIGTNTEITLAHQGRLYSCSCASGPAFEGAHIQFGMRAAPGAIEKVQFIGESIRVHTIGSQPAVGICGSGILDSIAQMLAHRIIDRRGMLSSQHPLVQLSGSKPELVLAPSAASGHGKAVTINRKDVHEIQLAKAAIRLGIEELLKLAGIRSADLEEFIVAGAFGTYIDIESAIQVGMFPDLPRQRFKQVGNAAGAGARQMLLSTRLRRTAQEFARRMQYLELSNLPNFSDAFIRWMYFPAPE